MAVSARSLPSAAMRLPRPNVLVPALATSLLVACTGRLNEATGPMGASLPDLSPTVPPTASTMTPEVDASWRPGVVDRSQWTVVEIAAPRGQVETNPTPAFEVAVMPGRGAPSDAMPTAGSAVSVAEDGGRVALQGIADPFRSAWSLIESPYGLVVRPPWARVVGPRPACSVIAVPTTAGASAAAIVVETSQTEPPASDDAAR